LFVFLHFYTSVQCFEAVGREIERASNL